ncbi:MAG: DUF4132 domain-containing protein [Gemmatimonadaceae bacterium]|nr:DUF4132 domain-containing protein [Chitinophagaceae bacterium]
MAYTISEIETALSIPYGTVTGDSQLLVEFRQSSISDPVINFLIRDSELLVITSYDPSGIAVVNLLNLLRDIAHTSPDEEKIMAVLGHPQIYALSHRHFNKWLINAAIQSDDPAALAVAIKRLSGNGISPHDIFSAFLQQVSRMAEDEIKPKGEQIVLNYLKDQIRKTKKLVYPGSAVVGFSQEWNLLYLQLLEEVKPEFAAEYLTHGIYATRNNSVLEFAAYRDGFYLPAIRESLEDTRDSTLYVLQTRLASAILLDDAYPQQFTQLKLNLAEHYLRYFLKNYPKENWENFFSLKDFDGAPFPYTTCAFYFLLKEATQTGRQLLDEFFAGKAFMQLPTLKMAQITLGNDALPYFEMASKMDFGNNYTLELLSIMEEKFDAAQSLPIIWNFASNKSAAIKEKVATFIAMADPHAEQKAVELLGGTKKELRQTAAFILSKLPSESAKSIISEALDGEENDNARDILLQSFTASLPEKADSTFVMNMVNAAKKRGKLSKPVEPEYDENSLPHVYDKQGTALSSDYVRFLLYRMSRVSEMTAEPEAKFILALIDREKSSAFSNAVFQVFLDKGAKPEHKYILALVALMGGDAIVDKIRINTNKWIEENRHKMAEFGIKALALHGSNKALRWIEWYSRKFKTKKAKIGAAAIEALEIASQQLGITTYELADSVIPDFGFNGLFKEFSAGNGSFRAFVDNNFKIAFLDESNKKLKSMPSAAATELKEEFKAIDKEIKDIVRSQSSRMEYYLIIQRRWSTVQWEQLFLSNPVMFIYATRLLWGIYNSRGELQSTFLCNDDTSLIDLNDEEVALPDDYLIGLVHPFEMGQELLTGWKRKFFELSIVQPFAQLDRKIFSTENLDLSASSINQYKGKETMPDSIRGTLEKFGWHRGAVMDGGMIESFNQLYDRAGLVAVLEVEGVGAAYGWGGQEKLGRLYVVKQSATIRNIYHLPLSETEENMVKLRDVPAIFLNEMLMAVESIKLK